MGNEIGKGFGAKTGLHKESVYGSPVAVGSGDLLRIISERIAVKCSTLEDRSIHGRAGQGAPDRGNLLIGGPIVSHLRYWNRPQILLLALAMGGCSVAEVASLVYACNLRLTDSLEGLFATLVIDKGARIYEYESIKVNTLDLKCLIDGEGSRVTLSSEIIARDCNRSSAINTPTEIAALTMIDADYPAGYLLSTGLKAYLGAAEGGPLGEDDEVGLKGFSLKLSNNLAQDLVESGNSLISEPLRADFRTVSLRLELGKYQLDGSSDTWLDAYMSNTPLKCKLSFTGALITGAYYNQFNLYFPNLRITGAPRNVSGPGLIEAPIDLIATMPTTAVSGMETGDELLDSDVLEEMRITLQNRQSTSILEG